MDLRPFQIFYAFVAAIDFNTLESDALGCQNLTSKVSPRNDKVNAGPKYGPIIFLDLKGLVAVAPLTTETFQV